MGDRCRVSVFFSFFFLFFSPSGEAWYWRVRGGVLVRELPVVADD